MADDRGSDRENDRETDHKDAFGDVPGDNPFERYDLDPLGGPEAITERLRELAQDAPSDAERRAIRAAWEALTLHPLGRLRAALHAHPSSHPPLGAPPPSPRVPPPRAHGPLDYAELLLTPSPLAALAQGAPALPDVPLDRDPHLQGD